MDQLLGAKYAFKHVTVNELKYPCSFESIQSLSGLTRKLHTRCEVGNKDFWHIANEIYHRHLVGIRKVHYNLKPQPSVMNVTKDIIYCT